MTQKHLAKQSTLTPRRPHEKTQATQSSASEAPAQTLQAAVGNPASASPAHLLSLQRAYGNRAVGEAIQRASAVGAAGGALDNGTQSAIQSARSGGLPLDRNVGAAVGHSLGADFSGVKVHTDSRADSLNRSLSAEAFTLGTDIFFSQGAYKPNTSGGQKLLAHELTHVAQQGGGRWNKVQPKLTVGAAGDRYEQEADRVASALAAPQHGLSSGTRRGAAGSPTKHPARQGKAIARRLSGATGGTRVAAPAGVIQRKLGFEFEGNFRTHLFLPEQNNNKPISDDQKEGRRRATPPETALKPIKKGTALASGARFEVQADELPSGKSDLEFVTTLPPFDETLAERNELKKTMLDIKGIGDKLSGSSNRYIQADELPHVNADIPTALIEQPMTKTLQGSPQATIALRLDQVNKVMQDTGEAKGNANPKLTAGREDLMGMSKKDSEIASRAASRTQKAIEVYRKTIKSQKNLDDHDLQIGSGELIGLVTLLATYLIRGEEEKLSYAKNITIMLARTDFATMFKQLTTQEQKHFRASDGQAFVELVLSASGLAGTDDVPVFRQGLNYEDKGGKTHVPGVLDSLTRRKWLSTITKGKDLMTAKHIGGGRKDEMESLGALGKRTEKVGRGVNAPIFELRRMKNKVPYTEWPALALDVFDYVLKLNKGKDSSYKRKNEGALKEEAQEAQDEEQREYMRQRSGQEEF